MRAVECVWPGAAELGEGPVWSTPDQALWFVDIKGRAVLRFDPATATRQTWAAPDQISFILPETGGDFIVGLPGQLARFSPATGAFEQLVEIEPERPHNRLNDACVDSAGRLWFGTMDDLQTEASGGLYSWHGAGAPIAHDQDFVISNGPAHSPDGRTMYHTDTVRQTIFRFDAAETGEISNKKILIQIEDSAGFPDGTTIDSEGCLWVAIWNGGQVRRYSPQGKLLETVALPCSNVTKIAFGGPDLKTAFVTTARVGLSQEALAMQHLAGSIFTFEVDVPGLPSPPIASAFK